MMHIRITGQYLTPDVAIRVASSFHLGAESQKPCLYPFEGESSRLPDPDRWSSIRCQWPADDSCSSFPYLSIIPLATICDYQYTFLDPI